jgi:4-hydroxy-tetrahydrodipicolinate synthase
MMYKELRGVIPALVTPFDDNGKFQEDMFTKTFSALSRAGVHGFFIAGTTGEGPYLFTDEIVSMTNIASKCKKAEQFVCVASLRPSTGQVLREIEAFQKAGADFLVAVPPFYFRQSDETIIAHYEAIAANSSIPIIIYDIAQHTSNYISPEVRWHLAKNRKFAGLKDSTGQFQNFSRCLLENTDPEFKWIQGDDSLYAPSFLMGAAAVVSGLANIDPKPYLKMYEASLSGDRETVIEVQRWIFRLLEIVRVSGGKVIHSIKYALTLMGRSEEWLREKSERLSAGEKAGVQEALTKLGLLQ